MEQSPPPLTHGPDMPSHAVSSPPPPRPTLSQTLHRLALWSRFSDLVRAQQHTADLAHIRHHVQDNILSSLAAKVHHYPRLSLDEPEVTLSELQDRKVHQEGLMRGLQKQLQLEHAKLKRGQEGLRKIEAEVQRAAKATRSSLEELLTSLGLGVEAEELERELFGEDVQMDTGYEGSPAETLLDILRRGVSEREEDVQHIRDG